jgi:site-specific recombinase XerD
MAWCEERGLSLPTIRPVHVAAYIEKLSLSPPTVKQHLAAIRMLFDWLVVSQVIPMNPAAAVRGPKYVVKRGKTPVLSPEQARKLLDSIKTDTGCGIKGPGDHRGNGLQLRAGGRGSPHEDWGLF